MEKQKGNKFIGVAYPQQHSLEIARAYTFLLIPFFYESDSIDSPFHSYNRWKKDDEIISNEGEDGEVLYSYIMNFLQGQMKSSNIIQDHLDIYSMSIDKESKWYLNFWSSFINHSNIAFIPAGKDEANKDVFRPIKFKILSSDEEGFKAPHVFIYKKAKIGILTFCIELAEKKKLICDLKLLNYHLHKINKPLCLCVCPNIGINEKRSFSNEEEQKMEEVRLKEIRTFIAPHNESEDYSPYNSFTWNMRGICELLFEGIEHQLFSNIRIHLFTYCQIDDSENECLTKNDLLPDLLRLSRCVSDKYLLPFDDLINSDAILQCFDNIYYASSVEGSAIIAVAKKANKGFISQMDGNVRLRYLWIYMLAVIQRYTLLNMNRQLLAVASTNNEMKLWDLIKTIKDVKIRCYYTDVSPYTQHDQFYQLCCKNLHVKDAFDEIDEKTSILNITISHDMQDLLKEQEHRQNLLTIGLSAFAVFSIACDLYTLIKDAYTGDVNPLPARIFLWFSPVIILIIFIFFIKNRNNGNE